MTSQQKEPGPSYIRALFDKEPGYMLRNPSTKKQSDFKRRPSNFLFQIARGSGATLSECTFSFKKAHITQKTSSRQTTSRPHDKKNPDIAISELFFDKEPGYMLRSPLTKNQSDFKKKTLQLLVPNSKRLGGYTQMGVLFSSKKYTPREDLMKRYMVSLKKALGRRLFLLDKT